MSKFLLLSSTTTMGAAIGGGATFRCAYKHWGKGGGSEVGAMAGLFMTTLGGLGGGLVGGAFGLGLGLDLLRRRKP